MWRIRGWGSIVFAMLIPGILLTAVLFNQTRAWMFITIFYMTILVVLLSLFLWQGKKMNVQQRVIHTDLMQHEPLEVEVVICLQRVGLMWFGIRAGEHRRMFVPVKNKRIRYRYSTKDLTARRGKYTLPPVVLEGGDALGWFGMKREFFYQEHFWVYPHPELPETYRTSWLNKNRIFSGRNALRQMSREGDLRLYKAEDGLRYVDWKASAKSEQLYVRERHHSACHDSWIVVPDCGWGQDFSEGIREKVIGIAAALMGDSTQRLPGLLTSDGHQTRVIFPGQGSSIERMRQLAEWDASRVMTLSAALSRATHIKDIRHRLLIITPRLSSASVHMLEAYEPGMIWQFVSSTDDLRRLQHRGWVTIGPDEKVVDSHAN